MIARLTYRSNDTNLALMTNNLKVAKEIWQNHPVFYVIEVPQISYPDFIQKFYLKSLKEVNKIDHLGCYCRWTLYFHGNTIDF